MFEETVETHSAEETRALARRLAGRMPPGTVVCLVGELGAGKTCLAQGIAQALGIQRPVGSPTFTLINEYPGNPPFAHMDLYRIAGDDEAFGLGLEDYLDNYPGISVIEWPERARALIPQTAWWIELKTLATAPDSRTIHIRHP